MKFLERITRDEIERQFGPIEAQAVGLVNGEVFVWTSTHVVFIHPGRGETLRAVPRHPPGSEPRS
jgi:hypothetical protein